MITTVYLAGASAEIDRARKWADALKEADITLMSTWINVIGKASSANPTDATIEQLTKWVLRDLAEVRASDILWLLLPTPPIATVGAWIELGIAYTIGKTIVMSGVGHRPIFTPVLAHHSYETDEEAFAWIQARHRRLVARHVENHFGYQNEPDEPE